MNLLNVTLVCANCIEPTTAYKALKYSCKNIKFGRVILFSHIPPTKIIPEIEYIQIPKFDHLGSCYFHLKEFNKYVNTEFCLSIHDDGFIINPHLWSDEFFKYDYIGAPWPDIYKHRVGNGGFCLKSKKFLDLCQPLNWQGQHDDGFTCIDNYEYFVQNGCKFAPVDVAYKFALESKIPECEYNLNNCFGFHGRGEVESVFQQDGQQFKDRIKLLDNVII